MALTRAQQICIIMGPLDMRGLVGTATIMGCLKYGLCFFLIVVDLLCLMNNRKSSCICRFCGFTRSFAPACTDRLNANVKRLCRSKSTTLDPFSPKAPETLQAQIGNGSSPSSPYAKYRHLHISPCTSGIGAPSVQFT